MQYEEIKQGYEFGYQRVRVLEDVNYIDSNYSDIVWIPGWSECEVWEKVKELLAEYKRTNAYPKVYYKIWMRPVGLICVKDIE